MAMVEKVSKLREIREQEGMSRRELAEYSDVSERTIARAESGAVLENRTKWKILNGLNDRSRRGETYRLADLFEDADGGTATSAARDDE